MLISKWNLPKAVGEVLNPFLNQKVHCCLLLLFTREPVDRRWLPALWFHGEMERAVMEKARQRLTSCRLISVIKRAERAIHSIRAISPVSIIRSAIRCPRQLIMWARDSPPSISRTSRRDEILRWRLAVFYLVSVGSHQNSK